MSLFHKLPHKPHSLLSILLLGTRSFTTRNPNPNSFPDEPTSAYYDELVLAAGRSRDFEELRHLLNKRIRDGCFNTSKTFKFISNNDASLSILDNLSQTLARLDKGLPQQSAHNSLILRLCKLGRVEESLRLIDTMARGEYGLNASSFHPILNVLTRKKEMEAAWGVISLMRKYQIPPDLTAYNYFLMAYCFSGDLTAAAEVLTKMLGEGLRADTRTYDALLLGACKVGKVESALALLRRMVDDGVPMLLSTHMYLINALLRMGYYEQAIEYARCFAGKDTWLDCNIFGCLAGKLKESRRFDEAKLILEEMNRRGLKMGDKLRDFYSLNVKKIKGADKEDT
ncbi:hypothetical protein I3843_02G170900 [Carya illinoinensis]|uniref:PROP1-like PPR domain-containing protein n=1 Tax=Carya illinoinensis TaxID=32201 RepID=A0A922K2F5_CARIL|nr:hypothetical protein I3760_02G194400 [Carya illinoinensis]KAG6728795.1 hypothetical protein I3842_02G191400 [Carya illinoinensis]KAG7993281.1 hypothetical protein I3843_02G170900 [Carya illinoinensis]